ncbi:benzoate-CoA ligase family protein [Paracraurococcus ruber]|uniref:2-aminobenzoate-CoA ligase n=1 Tax=Paracraurococcus ruber TaxID=77675 RepID=A0ABS1CY05_9PROT|nr:benzoate-CoA ligase family protein [Paracraurococcus ruber]MBK1659423.1 2-aminobenzoate-CoA ligase [Paracraurococcus ruber]TDG34136.1 benzoate-CoA ligase family protein [Paracraurococcus ruber]
MDGMGFEIGDTRSAHLDSFARDNLPPREAWPELRFTLPQLRYPARLNCAVELLDRNLATRAGHPAVVTAAETLTYAQLAARVNRIAHVLVHRQGLVPGNRVLLRGANTAWMVAAYFAVLKAGGVVVATMPLLRAKEIGQMLRKARISHALCDARLAPELRLAAAEAPDLRHVLHWGDGALEALCAEAPPDFPACDTAAEDVCLIGFTSGTTGEPKGTMHFHRDMLAICDAYGREVLRPTPDDIFIGSPPLAFTFGLGGLVLFPFRVGATAVLLEKPAPEELLPAIARHRATICFTAPTAYRAMALAIAGGDHDVSSLRKCVSAGEALPRPVFDLWQRTTGLPLMDGIGATEMLHIFIAAPEHAIRPGATGLPVPGYEAKVIGPDGAEAPRDTPGRLAVRGPTGCRYLADPRQAQYVQGGWNITGDTYVQDADGYFWYQARSDDMIISAGYNIAGPEVEAALLTHPTVAECGVVGAPDEERGQVVKAFIVLKPGIAADAALARALQDHVKAAIAPYKYPRAVAFVAALPRTETGKLQRFALRRQAQGPSA